MKFDPDSIDLKQFDYLMPKDKIALFPLEERSKSKLLIANAVNQSIEDKHFECLDSYIPEGSLLCINSTKVIEARLNLFKPSGGQVELLIVSPKLPSFDPQITLSAKHTCQWECIVGGRNVLPNMILKASVQTINFQAIIKERIENRAIVEFIYDENISFAEVINKLGKIPLPPYINREVEQTDSMRYQTVYSNMQGSVAAPTAGLHFTDDMLNRLKERNIAIAELLLHVGPGTFKPIDSDVKTHDMHSEQFFVTRNALNMLLEATKHNNKIVATGTTSLRTLETIFWLGFKIYHQNFNPQLGTILLEQFEAYSLFNSYSKISLFISISSLLNYMENNKLDVIYGETKLFILPGYEIQTADMLITNFHLPKSTLLMLVSAFIGEEMRQEVYDFALNNDYRFLSYGDTSLLIR